MYRSVILAAAAALVLAAPVEAKRAVILYTPVQKLTRAEVVVVGKVTAIEKDTVDAPLYPGVKEKTAYKVAVIKVESALVGAANVTHVKVGFVPAAAPAPGGDPAVPPRGRPIPGRGGFGPVTLTEGQEGLFYLSKHHSADFYTINPMMAPLGAKDEGYKDQLAQVKQAAAVIADPMKGLKADKATDRLFAANVLVQKYRSYPEGGGEAEQVKIGADESKLVLKAIAEGDWKNDGTDPNAPNAYQAFSMIGLNDKDGWKYPMVKPGEDFIVKTKEAYVAWLAGAGKDYQISKWVPKKK